MNSDIWFIQIWYCESIYLKLYTYEFIHKFRISMPVDEFIYMNLYACEVVNWYNHELMSLWLRMAAIKKLFQAVCRFGNSINKIEKVNDVRNVRGKKASGILEDATVGPKS